LLVRELVLGLKKGVLDIDRLHRKFGVDPLAEWAVEWRQLADEGFLDSVAPRPVLSRRGLLQVDALLHRFFAPSPE
jgi:oxygen-independent coproporphyrinogen-3 oxidase